MRPVKPHRHWLALAAGAALWCFVAPQTGYADAGQTAAQSAATGQELQQFDNTAQQQLFRQLTAELRCPKCQNQNIADSNAVVAVDMRNKTYELVRQGSSHAEVIAYMKARYGDFVHYQPPVRLSTIWLWLLPAAAVLLLAMTAVRRSRLSRQTPVEPVPLTDQGLDAELQALIDAASRPDQRGGENKQ